MFQTVIIFHERKIMSGIKRLSSNGWTPSMDSGWRQVHVRDPIQQKVYLFSADNPRCIVRQETDFINLRDLNKSNRHNRKAGISQFLELTHPFRNHKSKPRYTTSAEYKRQSSPMTQFVDDSILHHDLRPFRVGK